MKYKCAICDWTGSEDELYSDRVIDPEGGETWCDTVCPECLGWATEKVGDDDNE